MICKNFSYLLFATIVIFTVFGSNTVTTEDVPKKDRMCVPQHMFEDCEYLLKLSPKSDLECVKGRDRIDCIDIVHNGKADFLAVDPEDMYLAHRLRNDDFTVFSEIRTLEEPEAEFRYEGIILVKKNSTIKTLSDFKGKKSCHTGFGRNVGYKIPLTRLKLHGLLEVSNDPLMSPVEKELNGLTKMFSESCLVAPYSPNEEVNRILKKKYHTLCALCEDPVKCDYPDKYSGYDGAIRCLKDKGGDVAFTKVIYVKRFFGLPIGKNPSKTIAEGDPKDFEYLCEDGTRRPVDGPACSWAQRPWQGYMGNQGVRPRVQRLYDRINNFYNDGKKAPNKDAAKHLWIKDSNLVVKKKEPVSPGEHLKKAQYIDVIERDGLTEQKIRFCVTSSIELRKCNNLKDAAYSRDIRPEFECLVSANCPKSVQDNEADVVVLSGDEYVEGRKNLLNPILYEAFKKGDSYVAIVDDNFKTDSMHKSSISYDTSDSRAEDAALLFNHKRGVATCPETLKSIEDAPIKIIKTSDLHKYSNKVLICPDQSRQPISVGYDQCNFDATLPHAIFVRNSVIGHEMDNIAHAFISLSDEFGHEGEIEDVFEMFGEFEPNQENILFSDDADKFVTQSNYVQSIDETLYTELHCIKPKVEPSELYQPGHHY